MIDVNDQLDTLLVRCDRRELVTALLEAAGENILILGEADHLLFCGARVAALLGHAPDALLGRRLADLLSADQQTARITGVSAHQHTFSFSLKHHDGTPVEMVGRVIPLDASADMPSGAVCILHTVMEDTQPRTAGMHLQLPDAHVQVLEESNHRVRNNLAMICALLEMEMLQASEAECHRLRVSLARTRSLALPHNLMDDASGTVEVAILVRAVIDNVRSLYKCVDGTIQVNSLSSAVIDSRHAAYLALALTELAVHFIHCAVTHEMPVVSLISVSGDGREIHLAVEGSCHPESCPSPGLAALSRDILVGLVERSLRGKLEMSESHPFRVTICCPVPAAIAGVI